MKKNKFLKLASGLLVLCLLTTCVISTTFAKYTTSGSANDTARVAKWGVEIGVQADAFANAYDANGTVTNDAGTAIVKTVYTATDNLVAPGTKGTLVMFQISGAPEVAVDLDFVVAASDVSSTNATDVYLDTYYPIKYTLQKKGAGDVWASDAGATDVTLAELETYLEEMSDNFAVEDPTAWNEICGDYQVLWRWDFHVDEATDILDTKLGDIADDATKAAGSVYSLEVDFKLTITATQID